MSLYHHLTLASPGDQVMRGLYVGAKFSTYVQMDIDAMHEQQMDKGSTDLDDKRTKYEQNVESRHEHDPHAMVQAKAERFGLTTSS